ncbi:MAG: LPS assembly lipoprotein LptE [Chloroflexota bacterium]
MVSNNSRHNSIRAFLLSLALMSLPFLNGCKVSYSFSGASTTGVNTINVIYFQNRASLVQPGLSQNLTDALIDKCRSETSLKFVKDAADVTFEGEISDYNTRPLTVGADARAATNRFSITVKVKFTNVVKPELSYEQTFSRYADYDSNLDLSQVEGELSSDIVEMIVEDIFNQAFVNW